MPTRRIYVWAGRFSSCFPHTHLDTLKLTVASSNMCIDMRMDIWCLLCWFWCAYKASYLRCLARLYAYWYAYEQKGHFCFVGFDTCKGMRMWVPSSSGTCMGNKVFLLFLICLHTRIGLEFGLIAFLFVSKTCQTHKSLSKISNDVRNTLKHKNILSTGKCHINH